MLKIVFPICCGIDVHKTFLVATVATTNEKNITSYLEAAEWARNLVFKPLSAGFWYNKVISFN